MNLANAKQDLNNQDVIILDSKVKHLCYQMTNLLSVTRTTDVQTRACQWQSVTARQMRFYNFNKQFTINGGKEPQIGKLHLINTIKSEF